MNYEYFFKLLGNEEPLCFINCVNPIPVKQIPKYNGKKDLFFITNSGGTKTKDITKFNAFFIDLDCGRDENGEYFPPDIVDKYKEEQMKKLKSFHLKPNCIVSTRNGYHCYWFIRQPIDLETWNSIEKYLVNYFDADKKVCSAANKLRIPYTYWVKNPDEPFFCKIVMLNDDVHDVLLYRRLLKNEKTESKEKICRSEKQPKKASSSEKKLEKVFQSYRDAFDYVTKEVSMLDYLRKYYNLQSGSSSFRCIFHDDKNASAGIFKTDNGIELYYCHSASCGFVGNIVQTVAQIENCSRSGALRKICNDLNLKFVKNQELVDMIFDNLQTITDDIQYSHKDLYGVIYRYIPTLNALHFAAFNNLIYANNDQEFLFSASTSYIAKILGKNDKKKAGTDISLLCLLKMIEKIDLDDDNISEEYKAYIKRFQKDKSKYINVYSLQSYSYNKLTECNSIAKQVKEKNLRKKHFTYESVANAFDVETANRVFPQVKNKKVREIDVFLLDAIKTLLKEYGYFTQNTVADYYKRNNRFFKENQYIKQLPAIMQMLELKRVKASKELKEKYNILFSGYPYLYIKQGD